jgi:hypothetical protein
MNNERLTVLAALLKDELEKLEPNKNNRQLIENLQNDLKLLEQTQSAEDSSSEEGKHSFLEGAVHFEESHPKLARTLNDIAHILSGMGI